VVAAVVASMQELMEQVELAAAEMVALLEQQELLTQVEVAVLLTYLQIMSVAMAVQVL
jgi:hypothetical protein